MAEWIRKLGSPEEMTIHKCGETEYLSFPALDETGLVTDAFSSRLGGASRGIYATMNFSYTRGDDAACVHENYRRMALALGLDMERMVTSYQTHTTNVRVVSEDDCGKGVVRERDYTDVDGLITNIEGICLVGFYADCVPLYFLDPVNKAIGLSHSGWRGTLDHMGRVTLDKMKSEYGTEPKDVIACIGPSICRDCYEVGEDVAEEFRKTFSPEEWNDIFQDNGNGKYKLDLWRANQIVLEDAGIPKTSVHVTDICTRCNHDLIFSHRFQGPERGNSAAFLCLTS